MYTAKVIKNANNGKVFSRVKERGGSVFNNKETLLHFSPSDDNKEAQSAFLLTHYRARNLKLAENLESFLTISPTADDYSETFKTIRNLRWCSGVAMVEADTDGNGQIFATSKTCKNPNCCTCARNRASKIVNRLHKAMSDDDNKSLFDGLYAYHLVLTVKHNLNDTRNYVYLDEFKDYQTRLFRSKLMRELMPKGRFGRISSVECTIGDNGYHIHAHVLLLMPKATKKITDLEADIRAKWLKITGDSHGVRLDLVKPDKDGNLSVRTVKEIVKYNVKVGDVRQMSMKETALYADWIEATKGKNFVNVAGVFRGLELTGDKSRYDEKAEPIEFKEDAKYFMVKTASLKFNHSPNGKQRKVSPSNSFSRKKLREIIKTVQFKEIEGYDVSHISKEMYHYLSLEMSGSVNWDKMVRWIEYESSAKAEADFYKAKADEVDVPKIEDIQISLFAPVEESCLMKYW